MPIYESVNLYFFIQMSKELSTYWPVLADKLPEKLTSRVTPLVQVTHLYFHVLNYYELFLMMLIRIHIFFHFIIINI